MSFPTFIAICLVGVWALLPISMIIASRDFDNELMSDHSDDH